jgi:hypothetical protein
VPACSCITIAHAVDANHPRREPVLAGTGHKRPALVFLGTPSTGGHSSCHLQAHAFNAGVCLATLCIASPGNPLAPLALSRLSNVHALLHQVSQTLNLPLGGISKNLECLRSLEKHAVRNRTAFLENRPVQGSGLRTNLELVNNGTPLPNEVDPSALIGWQTRLVKMSPDEPQGGAVLSAGNGAPPGPLPALGRVALPHASPISTRAPPISNDSLVDRSHLFQELDGDLGDLTDPDTVGSD